MIAPSADRLSHQGCGLDTQIMQQPEAALFSAPVSDADAPGYSSVVSRPMDLGTIKGRLQRKKYLHPAEVYADIRQVLRCAALLACRAGHPSASQAVSGLEHICTPGVLKLEQTISHCVACQATEQCLYPWRHHDFGKCGLYGTQRLQCHWS